MLGFSVFWIVFPAMVCRFSSCPPEKVENIGRTSQTLHSWDQRMFRITGAQYITVPKHLNNLHLGINNKERTKQNTDVNAVRTACKQTTMNHGHLARAAGIGRAGRRVVPDHGVLHLGGPTCTTSHFKMEHERDGMCTFPFSHVPLGI